MSPKHPSNLPGNSPYLLARPVMLLGVLLAKATIEERALVRRFPGYQDYRVRTTRFVPWLV